MALRMIPASTAPTSTSDTAQQMLSTAPSVPGLHDTLRHGLPTLSSSLNTSTSAHPIASRIANWETTQHDLKMEQLRRIHGVAAPIARAMELQGSSSGRTMQEVVGIAAGRRSVQEEILRGTDCELGWEDVWYETEVAEGQERGEEGVLTKGMERVRGMNW